MKLSRRKFVRSGALWVNAATLYCGPSATGNGSGSDFNNRMVLPNTTLQSVTILR